MASSDRPNSAPPAICTKRRIISGYTEYWQLIWAGELREARRFHQQSAPRHRDGSFRLLADPVSRPT